MIVSGAASAPLLPHHRRVMPQIRVVDDLAGHCRGQVDISARVIWLFEKLGWAWQRTLADAAATGQDRSKGAGKRVTVRSLSGHPDCSAGERVLSLN